MEAPESWFVDVLRFRMDGRSEIRVPLDPLWLETVAPGTVEILAVTPDRPVRVMAALVDDGWIEVSCETPAGTDAEGTLLVGGIRLGFDARRFPEFTRTQMARNNAFWAQAHQPPSIRPHP
jgi:hypothetical protein